MSAMRTKKITLYYKATHKEIVAPPPASLLRKDAWLKEIQRTISPQKRARRDEKLNTADAPFRYVKVVYELFNPEVEQQRKFFNGPVVDYWTIQKKDLMSGEVPRIMHDRAREELLSDVLGYDVPMLTRTERRRKSSSDFTSTQKWHDFFETLRETEFDPNGYEFPDSEHFWDLAKKHGYETAHGIAIEQLRKRIQAKMVIPSEG